MQFLRAFVVITAILGTISSCSQAQDAPAQPSSYHGIVLPSPEPLKGFPSDFQLPPVWLLAGTGAVLATPGTFQYKGASAIATAPHLIGNLATSMVPAQQPVRCIIASTMVAAVQAHTSNWVGASESGEAVNTHELTIRTTLDGQFTVVTLEPLTNDRDHLLVIKVTFGEGTVHYMWRLNPVQ